MADLIKRKKDTKLIVDAEFELQLVNGEIKTFPLKLTSWQLLQIAKLEETGNYRGIINAIRNDVYKLPTDIEVSDEEIWETFQGVGEYIKGISPKG